MATTVNQQSTPPHRRTGRRWLLTSWLFVGGLATAAATGQGPTGAVSVSGNHLLRDGVPWVSHGFVCIAFVAPPAAQRGRFLDAYQHFSRDELAGMKAWGADTVRFQVSQPGLDPQNPLHTARFVAAVKNAVLDARSVGLNVIVSVQDESQSGEANPVSLPDAATRRVWQVLAPLFNGDAGILYEIINEPRLVATPDHWAAWAAAMNEQIAAIRQTGSRNVVVADGLNFAERLDGAPPLVDPENKVAYASHPYSHKAEDQTPQVWEQKFGRFARSAPVIVTEWTTIPKFYGDQDTPASALAFLHYLQARGIGLSAYAYDFGANRFGSTVQDYQGTPSTFAHGIQAGAPGFGPGVLVQRWYRTGAVPDTLQ